LKRRSVIWTEKAADSLNFFFEFIEKDSPAAAKKVKREIVLVARQLSKNAEMYQLDELYGNSEMNVRRFFRWSYKVVYQVFEKEVVILDVFHTRSNALEEE
jgi:plasmid stabilization system protein ParE